MGESRVICCILYHHVSLSALRVDERAPVGEVSEYWSRIDVAVGSLAAGIHRARGIRQLEQLTQWSCHM